MFDSSAKVGSGLLKGNVFQVGDYEQCLDINDIVNGREIIGKYCNILLKPNFSWSSLNLPQHVSKSALKTK